MAISEKDILNLLEIELPEDATVEQLQEAFNEKFIALKMAGADPRVIGRINGAIARKAKQYLEPIVGGWEDGETDWNNPEKVIEAGVAKLSKQREEHAALIADLKKQSTSGNDKKLTEAMERLAQFEKELQAEREMKENTLKEFDAYKNNIITEKKQHTLKSLLAKPFESIDFADEFKSDEVIREGFNTILNRKFKAELSDDEKEVLVLNAETGERVKTQNGTDWEKWENIVKREAEARNYIKKNSGKSDVGNQFQQQQNQQQNNNNNNQQQGTTRRMAPEVDTVVIRA